MFYTKILNYGGWMCFCSLPVYHLFHWQEICNSRKKCGRQKQAEGFLQKRGKCFKHRVVSLCGILGRSSFMAQEWAKWNRRSRKKAKLSKTGEHTLGCWWCHGFLRWIQTRLLSSAILTAKCFISFLGNCWVYKNCGWPVHGCVCQVKLYW